MKQGVFWVIDNNLLAIPFEKSKYPNGIAKSGDTYNHEKLWKYDKPRNCNKPYNYYPRGRVVKGTKSKAIIYMNPNISNEFISSIKEMFEIKEEPIIKLDYSKHYKCCFGDDEQKYHELDSFVSARGITEEEIRSYINSEVDNGKL